MELRLKLEPRKPRLWEKKWKPKKPILYILEYLEGKWVNTYWWNGNWRRGGLVRFYNSAEVKVGAFFGSRNRSDHVWLVVGRSGTTLTVDGNILGDLKIKSLHPKASEWTCFGEVNALGSFTAKISEFNLEEKIKESYR
jgi:hypothetical protein